MSIGINKVDLPVILWIPLLVKGSGLIKKGVVERDVVVMESPILYQGNISLSFSGQRAT